MPSKRLDPLTDVFAIVSLSAARGAISRSKVWIEGDLARKRARLLELLDRAVQTLPMPSRQFSHLIRTLRTTTSTTEPGQLAQLLSDLGHPLINAAQAAEVLSVLQSKGEFDY